MGVAAGLNGRKMTGIGNRQQGPRRGERGILDHLPGHPDMRDLHASEDQNQNHRKADHRFDQHASLFRTVFHIRWNPLNINVNHNPAAIARPNGTRTRSEFFGGRAAFPAARS